MVELNFLADMSEALMKFVQKQSGFQIFSIVENSALIYTNKTGDCLSVCLSVCLFICSAMGGQTARPNGLKFGG